MPIGKAPKGIAGPKMRSMKISKEQVMGAKAGTRKPPSAKPKAKKEIYEKKPLVPSAEVYQKLTSQKQRIAMPKSTKVSSARSRNPRKGVS